MRSAHSRQGEFSQSTRDGGQASPPASTINRDSTSFCSLHGLSASQSTIRKSCSDAPRFLPLGIMQPTRSSQVHWEHWPLATPSPFRLNNRDVWTPELIMQVWQTSHLSLVHIAVSITKFHEAVPSTSVPHLNETYKCIGQDKCTRATRNAQSVAQAFETSMHSSTLTPTRRLFLHPS
jgi:hypothetical protein